MVALGGGSRICSRAVVRPVVGAASSLLSSLNDRRLMTVDVDNTVPIALKLFIDFEFCESEI